MGYYDDDLNYIHDDYYPYDDDSSSSSDEDVLDLGRVQAMGAKFGYNQCQLGYGEGVVAFRRASPSGDGHELVRVWWRTGTVGTYLKHPYQGKTQLFRRNVDNFALLGDIFNNPRRHTGRGYHRRR